MAGDDFTIEAFTLLAIAIVTIAIRITARWITAGPRNFQLDDFLMPLAGVCYPSSTITSPRVLIDKTGGLRVGIGRRLLRWRLVDGSGQQLHDR